MLIDATSTLTVGDTLVPLTFLMDGTHLWNFPGDKDVRPEYMTIGNLSSKIRQIATMHRIVMVALLPILTKNSNIRLKQLDEHLQSNWQVWNESSSGYSRQLPLNIIPAPRAGITKFPVQEATPDIANMFQQHGLQIAVSIVTYIIPSGMFVFGMIVQRKHMAIMSLQTGNTPTGITTHMERSVMPIPGQPMQNSRLAMFTKDSTCFDIFPASWATTRSLSSSIQWRSACLSSSRSGFLTSWTRADGWTSTMQSGYPSLLSTTSHQNICYMRQFLNGMGRRWREWASTCWELWPEPYVAAAPLIVPYSITQWSPQRPCWHSIFVLNINLMVMQHWAS